VSSNAPGYGSGLATPYGQGGTFSVSVVVTPTIGTFDCRAVQCAVVSRNDHTRSSDRSQDLVVAVGFEGSPAELPLATAPASTAAAADTVKIRPVSANPKPKVPVSVRSADGEKVKVSSADRIVSLNGSLSEIVFSLGLGNRLVGRDVSTTFSEAADVPLVTRAHDVSAESVLSQRPTVVLADQDTGPKDALRQIRDAGVPVVVFEDPTTIKGIGARELAVAQALGVRPLGALLRARTDTEIASARRDVPAKGEKPVVAFLYLRGQAGVYLLGGKGSGADAMIAAAGGIDAGTKMGLKDAFTPITSEALAAAAPDVILVTTTGLESVGGVEGLVKVPGVAQTPAGADRRIVSEEDGLLFSFGSRTSTALEHLVGKLHRGAGSQP
jgi:iron complex transport system substrate-binding protein